MRRDAVRWWWVLVLVVVLGALFAASTACGGDDDDDDTASDTDDDDVSADDDDDDDDDLDGDDDCKAPFDCGADDDDNAITLDLVDGCNMFATSSECVFPFPSSNFEIPADTPTGVKLDYPDDSVQVAEGTPPIDMERINAGDGHSPVTPILVHFGRDVHPDFLFTEDFVERSLADNAPIALVNADTGERVRVMAEMDANRVEDLEGRYALIIRPMQPLEFGGRYIVVLTNALTDSEGASFDSPPAFAALRDDVPTTNTPVEAIRDRYEDNFDVLALTGYNRDDLLLAWDFTVASKDFVFGPVLSMREEAIDEYEKAPIAYKIDKVFDNPEPNLARRVEGVFTVPNYLNKDEQFELDADGLPTLLGEDKKVPFTMIIPKRALTEGKPLPLMIFGHPLYSTGRLFLRSFTYLHDIAEKQGFIVVATDWRGLGTADFLPLFTKVLSDLNQIGRVTEQMQQSMINTMVLTELARTRFGSDPDMKVAANDLIDDGPIYYYGVSFGAIMGSAFMGMSPHVRRAALSLPGGGWAHIIPRSILWAPLRSVMQKNYPDPLAQQLGFGFIQQRFDPADSANWATRIYNDPLPDAPKNVEVLMQEAIGDCYVPNMGTEILVRGAGMNQLTPAVEVIDGLTPVTAPVSKPAVTQFYIVDEVEANPPPENNAAKLSCNAVHVTSLGLPNLQEQIEHFLADGEVIHPCDGICDPD
ncbi:hypothetical protein KDL45_06020 [bacterium]|nr:hypothetical protein [bacterium]